MDPRRPARRELRHLHERLRAARVQRQRLRRGVRRAVHLGPETPRGERGADRLRQGPLRPGDRRTGHRLRPVVPGRAAGHRGRRGRRDRLDHAGQRRRRAAPGAPAGAAEHPGGPARRADHHRQLRAPVLPRRRRARDRRRHPGEGLRRVRRLPAHAAGLGRPAAPGGHRHQGRGAAQGRRHRVGRAAVVQPAAGGAHPGAGERRRHLHEAGAGAGRRAVRRRRAGPVVLPAPGAPHRRVAARVAGARRPVAGLHRAGRRRAARRRGLPVRGGPGLGRRERAGGTRRRARRPGPGGGPDALGRRRRVQPRPGRLLHRGGDRRRGRRRTAGVRGLPGRLRAPVRDPGARGPPALRGPVPQRPAARHLRAGAPDPAPRLIA